MPVSSLEKMSIHILCPFLDGLFVFGFAIELYDLHINPLADIWFVNIFYSVGCLFIFLIVSFAVQKLFS